MKKIFQILIPVILLPLLALGQVSKERDVLANAGDYSQSPSLELSWTVGEVAVTTEQGGNLIVSQGFQQADANLVGIEDAAFPGEVTVFPNPVNDVLNFELNTQYPMEIEAALYDLSGKQVLEIPEFLVKSTHRGKIDFSNLPAGKWLLRFSDRRTGLSKTYTVMKVN